MGKPTHRKSQRLKWFVLDQAHHRLVGRNVSGVMVPVQHQGFSGVVSLIIVLGMLSVLGPSGRFPLDPVKRQLWIEAMQRKDWMPNFTTCLCSAHFKEDEIDRTANLVRIRVGAVPSVFATLSSGRNSRNSRKTRSVEAQGTRTTTPFPAIRVNTSAEQLHTGWSEEKLSLNIGRRNDKIKFRGGNSVVSSSIPCSNGIPESPPRTQPTRLLEGGDMTSHSESSSESDKAETCKFSRVQESKNPLRPKKEPPELGKDELLPDSKSEQVMQRHRIEKKSTINNQRSVPLTSRIERHQSFDSLEQKESQVEKTLKTQLHRKEERVKTLKKKIRLLQQTSRRMSKRVTLLKDVLNDMKTKLQSQETHSSSDESPGASWFLVKRQIIKKKGGKLQRIYNDKLKDFALTLNFMSPQAYDYVRRVFGDCLPHRKTISKWILKNRKQSMKDSTMGEQSTLEERGILTDQCALGDAGLIGAPGYVEVIRTDPEVSADVLGIRLGDEYEKAGKTLISL